MNKNKKFFHISVVIFFCIVSIFVGKVVRHTVMKQTLVKPGIGWSMINYINSGNLSFGLTIKGSSVEETVGATDNANYIFNLINIFKFTGYYEFEIYISILWNIIILLLIYNLKKSFTILETVFCVLSVMVLNIFDFCLAKEPIQMLYFVLMYIILKSKKSDKYKYIMCVGVLILCFVTYRNYYILMVGFMVFISLLYKIIISKIKNIEKKHIIIILVSIFLCYFVFLNVAKIIDVSSYNELIRVRLRTSEAVSDMRAIFKSNNLFVFTIDYIIMLIRMMLPLELIRLGPKYAIYTIYQIIISVIIIKNFININKVDSSKRMAMYIFVAFLMGSAAFEPDFGSWIRHEAAIFPVILIIMNSTSMEKRIEKNEKIDIKNN